MKARVGGSGESQSSRQGKRPWMDIELESENPAETATLRLAMLGKAQFHVYANGNAYIRFKFSRIKEEW